MSIRQATGVGADKAKRNRRKEKKGGKYGQRASQRRWMKAERIEAKEGVVVHVYVDKEDGPRRQKEGREE